MQVKLYFYRDGSMALRHYLAPPDGPRPVVDLSTMDLIWAGEWRGDATPDQVCEALFYATNARQVRGGFVLPDGRRAAYPEQRTHSSMSVGDVVVIDGIAHVCLPVGHQVADIQGERKGDGA